MRTKCKYYWTLLQKQKNNIIMLKKLIDINLI